MKKILASVIISLIILLYGGNILATKYENIKMNIDLPQSYYDLKNGIDTNDTKITYYEAILKTTKEEMKTQFEQNSIIYNGLSSNLSKQLILAQTENDLTRKVFHLHLATEKQLEDIKTELSKLAQNQSLDVVLQEIYTYNGINYIYSIIKDSSITIYQYYTIINGKGITISLNSSDTGNYEKELQEIVDTITFDELEEKPTDFTNYIIIGIVATLVIIVLILMYMAFFDKKKEE